MNAASLASTTEPLSEFNQTHIASVREHFRLTYEIGAGAPHAFSELEVSSDGTHILVVGSRFDTLVGHPRTAVYAVRSGEAVLISDPSTDASSPNVSPDGRYLAYLCDSASLGVLNLVVLDLIGNESPEIPGIEGTVEYVDWNPDSRRILLGVAGIGAEQAGRDGSGRNNGPVTLTRWNPIVESVDEPSHWRRLWMLDLKDMTLEKLSPEGVNFWEARWLGPDKIVAVTSPSAAEDSWYRSRLTVLTLSGKVIYPHETPDAVQVGFPAGSKDGRHIAFIEAASSDRGIISGELRVLDTDSGDVWTVDSGGADVTRVEWRTENELFFVGLRGTLSIIGTVDIRERNALVLHTSSLGISGAYHPFEATFDRVNNVYFLQEGYGVPQRLVGGNGIGKDVTLLAVEDITTQHVRAVGGTARAVVWTAPDGLELEGFVCTPPTEGPHPLILFIHGGPVIAYRDTWAMGDPAIPLLVSQGYAVFCPNPRGSAGRGQAFVQRVVGDMGGVETYDFLSGIDFLAAEGIYDGEKVGVMGCSYGGYMTAWLVTQDARFSAAVVMSPATNWLSQTYTSSLPSWTLDFLTKDLESGNSLAHTRSPALHASGVRTPCVVVGGAQDLCTPSGQSREFHRAVQASGTESTLVIYPLEGHSVQAFPAVIDHLARVSALFHRYMPARAAGVEEFER